MRRAAARERSVVFNPFSTPPLHAPPQRKQLHDVLRSAGYSDVFLGKRAAPAAAAERDESVSMLLDEAQFAHHCRTVVMRSDVADEVRC